MSDSSRSSSPAVTELIDIYRTFVMALLDTAYFHGGLLLLGSEKTNENPWLEGEVRKSFLKVGFEAHFVYRIAVLDSLLNSLTSLVLCHKPGTAIGDKDIKAGRLISATRAQIISEYIDNRVKQLSRESFVARIYELERILKVDFGFGADEYAELKRAAAVRNRIIHEGSSFEFTLNEDMSVRRKEQPYRATAKDWAYFQFIEVLGVKITSKVAEALFGSDGASFGGKSLHDVHPDTFLGYAIPGGRHKAYERIISSIEASEGYPSGE